MKRTFLAVVLILTLSAASFAKDTIAEGKTHSALGDYKIEMSDTPVMINGVEFKAFLISYQNTPLEVKVAVKDDGDSKKYYVLSDKLSVQYVCNKNYFGVEKLDKSFEKDGYSTTDANLNRSEYFHQKLLTSGEGCETDNTKLIAAYFPMLINNHSEIIAFR
jgi:hypothetical protein